MNLEFDHDGSALKRKKTARLECVEAVTDSSSVQLASNRRVVRSEMTETESER